MAVNVLNAIVSDYFFISTCQVIIIRPINAHVMAVAEAFSSGDFRAEDQYLTGSLAEFYINTVISCIGDMDIIWNYMEDVCQSRDDLENKRTINMDRGGSLLF